MAQIAIHLDSRRVGTSTNESEFGPINIYLKESITAAPDEDLLFHISSASIPFSFHAINQHNSFKLRVLTGGEAYESQISLVSGNYSITSLTVAIQKKINDFLASRAELAGISLTLSYSAVVNHFKFFLQPIPPGLFSEIQLIFEDQISLGKHIGFTPGTFSLTTESPSIEASRVATMFTTNDLFIRTTLTTTNNLELVNGEVRNSQIAQKIPITSNAWGVIFYNFNSTQMKLILASQSVQNFTLWLTDSSGTLLDLNGLHYSVTVVFEKAKKNRAISAVDLNKMYDFQDGGEEIIE